MRAIAPRRLPLLYPDGRQNGAMGIELSKAKIHAQGNCVADGRLGIDLNVDLEHTWCDESGEAGSIVVASPRIVRRPWLQERPREKREGWTRRR